MSTPNFVKHNAKNYYCVGLSNDEDDNYCPEWDYITEDVQQVAMSENKNWYNIDDSDRDRSYPMSYCTSRDYTLNYCGEYFYLSVKLGLRSAYYEGATIDYDIELSGDDWAAGTLEDGDVDGLVDGYIDDMQHGYKTISNGLFAMNKKRIADKLAAWVAAAVADCENICKICAQETLYKYAQFSNGEALYKRVS